MEGYPYNTDQTTAPQRVSLSSQMGGNTSIIIYFPLVRPGFVHEYERFAFSGPSIGAFNVTIYDSIAIPDMFMDFGLATATDPGIAMVEKPRLWIPEGSCICVNITTPATSTASVTAVAYYREYTNPIVSKSNLTVSLEESSTEVMH